MLKKPFLVKTYGNDKLNKAVVEKAVSLAFDVRYRGDAEGPKSYFSFFIECGRAKAFGWDDLSHNEDYEHISLEDFLNAEEYGPYSAKEEPKPEPREPKVWDVYSLGPITETIQILTPDGCNQVITARGGKLKLSRGGFTHSDFQGEKYFGNLAEDRLRVEDIQA